MKQIGVILFAIVTFAVPVYSQANSEIKQADRIDFPSLQTFLRSTLKKDDTLVLQAKGDLNQDGILDWVGIIKTPISAFAHTKRLFVLLGKSKSGYRLASTTGDASGGGMGCCWTADLQVKTSSIYITNVAKSVRDSETSTHQFKLHNGEWRLIGTRNLYVDRAERTSRTTDIDLLNGKVIEKDQRGRRKPTVKTYQTKFADHFLKDFDFEVDFGVEPLKEISVYIERLEDKDEYVAEAASNELIKLGPSVIVPLIESLKQKKLCEFQFIAAKTILKIDKTHPILKTTLFDLARGKCGYRYSPEKYLPDANFGGIISQFNAAGLLATEIEGGVYLLPELMKDGGRISALYGFRAVAVLLGTKNKADVKPEMIGGLKAAIPMLVKALEISDDRIRCDYYEVLRWMQQSNIEELRVEANLALQGKTVSCSE